MPKRPRSKIDSEDATVDWLYKICNKCNSCSLDELKALVQKFPNAIRVENMMASYHCIVLVIMGVPMKSFNF